MPSYACTNPETTKELCYEYIYRMYACLSTARVVVDIDLRTGHMMVSVDLVTHEGRSFVNKLFI